MIRFDSYITTCFYVTSSFYHPVGVLYLLVIWLLLFILKYIVQLFCPTLVSVLPPLRLSLSPQCFVFIQPTCLHTHAPTPLGFSSLGFLVLLVLTLLTILNKWLLFLHFSLETKMVLLLPNLSSHTCNQHVMLLINSIHATWPNFKCESTSPAAKVEAFLVQTSFQFM